MLQRQLGISSQTMIPATPTRVICQSGDTTRASKGIRSIMLHLLIPATARDNMAAPVICPVVQCPSAPQLFVNPPVLPWQGKGASVPKAAIDGEGEGSRKLRQHPNQPSGYCASMTQ
jgi:hypothetical protein